MPSGFIQLRRGLSEHVRDGRLSFFEAALYVFILMDTNPASGLCYGSAGLFAAVYGISSRTCRDALEKLELKGYLKRFPTRGKHGSYPILVNKFRCSDGAMKGKYVNCLKSISCDKVIYDLCDDSVDESAVASVNEGVNESAASKILETREERLDTKKQKPSAKAKPSQFTLPDWVDKDAWDGFEEMRKKKRAPMTDRAREGIIHDLEKLCPVGDNGAAILDQSTKKCWSGVFPLSKPNGGFNAAVPTGKTDANMAICAELIAEDQYRSRANENGGVQASEAKQDGRATLFLDSGAVGHESVSGGNGYSF